VAGRKSWVTANVIGTATACWGDQQVEQKKADKVQANNLQIEIAATIAQKQALQQSAQAKSNVAVPVQPQHCAMPLNITQGMAQSNQVSLPHTTAMTQSPQHNKQPGLHSPSTTDTEQSKNSTDLSTMPPYGIAIASGTAITTSKLLWANVATTPTNDTYNVSMNTQITKQPLGVLTSPGNEQSYLMVTSPNCVTTSSTGGNVIGLCKDDTSSGVTQHNKKYLTSISHHQLLQQTMLVVMNHHHFLCTVPWQKQQ